MGYLSPNPIVDLAIQAEAIRDLVGRDVFAYQKFFVEEGADKKIENNVRMTYIYVPSMPRTQDTDVDVSVRFVLFLDLSESTGALDRPLLCERRYQSVD